MLLPTSTYQSLMDENAELWVTVRYREAFAERSAFWVIYSDPIKRERLGSGITKKGAWVDAYRKLPKEVSEDEK